MIADASVLVVFAKAGHLDLLSAVAGSIAAPSDVYADCVERTPDAPDAASLRDAFEGDAFTVEAAPAAELARIRRRHPHLGPRETAAIALARAKAVPIALMDDRAARRAAKMEGLGAVGCLGILAAAIQRGVIERRAAHQVFSDLLEAGIWVSGAVVERFWQKVGTDD